MYWDCSAECHVPMAMLMTIRGTLLSLPWLHYGAWTFVICMLCDCVKYFPYTQLTTLKHGVGSESDHSIHILFTFFAVVSILFIPQSCCHLSLLSSCPPQLMKVETLKWLTVTLLPIWMQYHPGGDSIGSRIISIFPYLLKSYSYPTKSSHCSFHFLIIMHFTHSHHL